MDEKQFRAWNERMFKKYNNERLYNHPNPAIRYTESRRVRLMLKAVDGEKRVADIGCGEGHILSRIKSSEAVGVDISKTAIERASKNTKACLVQANAEKLPFSDSYFDAALCSEILEHTQKPGKVVRELSRIVKPGGRIVISVPNEPLINRIKDIVWNLGLFDVIFPDVPKRQNDEWHLHTFDLGVLKKHCEGVLELVDVEGTPFSFFPIRYVVLARNPKQGPPRSGSMFPKGSSGGANE